MQEYVDFFEYKKYTKNLNYSLKGRTAESVTRAIINWHEASDYAEKVKLLKLKWNGSNLKEIKLKQKGLNYLIKEITSGKELFSESEKMKHCVFSYKIKIWFLPAEKIGDRLVPNINRMARHRPGLFIGQDRIEHP